ncbi:hypothetical protein ABPG74_008995 [Tetrahymena malaccensis]
MSEKFDQFLTFIEELELEEYLPAIIENGFDDWDSLKELNEDLIYKCGICTEEVKVQQIIACIKGAEQYEYQKKAPQQKEQVREIVRRPNEISKVDIIKSAPKKKAQDVGDNKFLASINVLSMTDKKYQYIGEEIRFCLNIKTLHLFSNQLVKLDNLQPLTKLTTLQLDNNLLTKIEGLNTLVNLEKLYLNKNRIVRLEGLENCSNLREIQINNQQIGDAVFTFDDESMKGIGESLYSIECEKNNIQEIDSFIYLVGLAKLKISNNNIQKFDNLLEPLSQMKYLSELTAKGNPISTIQKYRDRIVLMSKSLQQLDDKKILPSEREFLLNLWRKKHGMLEEKKEDPNEKSKTKIDPSKTLASVEGKMIQAIYTDDQQFKNPQNYQKLNVAKDVRGNQAITGTKYIPKQQSRPSNQFF